MIPKRPLTISGPSGVGKSILSAELEQYGFRNVVKTTTRPARIGEIPGTDYEFLTREEFVLLSAKDEFIMADYFYNNFYGIRKKSVEEILDNLLIPLLQIHAPTITEFLKVFPETETVYLYPVSRRFLEKRINQRNQSKEETKYRLEQAEQELLDYGKNLHRFFKHKLIVSSDDNDGLIEFIRSIYD